MTHKLYFEMGCKRWKSIYQSACINCPVFSTTKKKKLNQPWSQVLGVATKEMSPAMTYLSLILSLFSCVLLCPDIIIKPPKHLISISFCAQHNEWVKSPIIYIIHFSAISMCASQCPWIVLTADVDCLLYVPQNKGGSCNPAGNETRGHMPYLWQKDTTYKNVILSCWCF